MSFHQEVHQTAEEPFFLYLFSWVYIQLTLYLRFLLLPTTYKKKGERKLNLFISYYAPGTTQYTYIISVNPHNTRR